MIERIISDIPKALDADCLFAALALSLTLPDICGKAEYPNEKNSTRKRYIDWYDKYVGQYEKPLTKNNSEEMPYLSGEVVYNLRNFLLHQGTPNIDQRKIKNKINQINYFVLKLDPKKEFDIYSDCKYLIYSYPGDRPTRIYKLSVRRLCLVLYKCAMGYYEANKEKFDFVNYHIAGEHSDKSEWFLFL